MKKTAGADKKGMDISPYVTRMSFNHLIISAIINDFSNPFWGNSMKIPLQSKLPVCPFGRTLFVDCESQCNALVKIKFTVIIMTIWHHRQTWHSSMLYRVHAIHIQYFLYPKFLISGYKMFNQLPFLHL